MGPPALHCVGRLAGSLWELALSCLGLQWVMPISVRQQLVVQEGFFGRRVKFKVLRAIPNAIFWLWGMERNMRVFVGVETSIERLKDQWLKALFF